MIERDAIEALIPHAGDMCLIDAVTDWDDTQIHCRAGTGDPAAHPLAAGGRLPGTALAEYGAQAMAVHGGLLAGPDMPARPGLLVALRDLELATDRITQPADLAITARRSGGDLHGASYEFEIRDHARTLARGTATVMFPDPETLS